MKQHYKFLYHCLVIGSLALAAQGQGFLMDFGSASPPSYIGGVTYVMVLDGGLNFNLGYFTTPATSAWLAQRGADNSLTPVFQMQPQTANLMGYGLVYSYTPGFPIFGDGRIRAADFQAGLWFGQFQFGSATYAGQLRPVPEPPAPTLALAFAAVGCLLGRIPRRTPRLQATA